jgi:hypothetical protein
VKSLKLALATAVVAVVATGCCCPLELCLPSPNTVGLTNVSAKDRARLPDVEPLVETVQQAQAAAQKF